MIETRGTDKEEKGTKNPGGTRSGAAQRWDKNQKSFAEMQKTAVMDGGERGGKKKNGGDPGGRAKPKNRDVHEEQLEVLDQA